MNRLFPRLCLVALATVALVGAHGHAAAAADRVLGMNVESYDLSAKDRADLLQVLQAKLARYPDVALIQPPEGELTDHMIELECVDIDTSCLSRLGIKYKADKVFYTQVDAAGGAWDLTVRVVDANAQRMVRDKVVRVADMAGLAPALEGQIEAVFGKPPAAATPRPGKLVIRATPERAKIFIGPDFVGEGAVSIERPPGDYTVRVQRDGFQEAVIKVTVAAGETSSRDVTLTPAAPGDGAAPGGGGAHVDDDDSDWILWAVVGAVVVGGAITAAALLSSEDDTTPRGPVVFSIDPNNAWRDAAVTGGR